MDYGQGRAEAERPRVQAIAGNLETVSSANIYLGDGINRISDGFDMETMRNIGMKGNAKISA